MPFPDPPTTDETTLVQRGLQLGLDHLRRSEPSRTDLWRFVEWALPRLHVSQGAVFQDLFALWASGKKRNGYFVDIGAADGRSANNTYLLESRGGWTGLLVEPNPYFWPSLEQHRTSNLIKKAAFSSSGGSVRFLATSSPWLSRLESVDPDDIHEAARLADFQEVDVETISPTDLLIQAKAPEHIDYLSIDTEGAELDILAAFDFDRWTVGAITVEHNYAPARERILELLTAKGFERLWPGFSRFEDWYVRPD